jgi:hypothetical protein
VNAFFYASFYMKITPQTFTAGPLSILRPIRAAAASPAAAHTRLLELGVTHVFNVPGDFNLPLLDSLAKVPGLTLVNTSNELNSAYAAGGTSARLATGRHQMHVWLHPTCVA